MRKTTDNLANCLMKTDRKMENVKFWEGEWREMYKGTLMISSENIKKTGLTLEIVML